MKIIVNFLNANTNEIVTIFLENYIDDVKKMQAVFNKISSFNSMVFNPYSLKWNVIQNGWPKIIDMIKANKRILIVDDEKRGYHAGKSPGIIRSRDFFVENHYSWSNKKYEWKNFSQIATTLLNDSNEIDLIAQFKNNTNTAHVLMADCYSLHKNFQGLLWYNEKPLNLSKREHEGQILNSRKLFIFNHFYGIKALTKSLDPITLKMFNKKEFIMKRLEVKCNRGISNKKPNYIVLDFIEKNHYTELIEPFNAS